VTRQQEAIILRLWRDWCRLWPEHYGPVSLQVSPEGYDPVFDVIPSQAYKDFYLEVVCDHPQLKALNAFEVIDTALNQVRTPESSVLGQGSSAVDEAEAFLEELGLQEERLAPEDLREGAKQSRAQQSNTQPSSSEVQVVEVDFETRVVTNRDGRRRLPKRRDERH